MNNNSCSAGDDKLRRSMAAAGSGSGSGSGSGLTRSTTVPPAATATGASSFHHPGGVSSGSRTNSINHHIACTARRMTMITPTTASAANNKTRASVSTTSLHSASASASPAPAPAFYDNNQFHPHQPQPQPQPQQQQRFIPPASYRYATPTPTSQYRYTPPPPPHSAASSSANSQNATPPPPPPPHHAVAAAAAAMTAQTAAAAAAAATTGTGTGTTTVVAPRPQFPPPPPQPMTTGAMNAGTAAATATGVIVPPHVHHPHHHHHHHAQLQYQPPPAVAGACAGASASAAATLFVRVPKTATTMPSDLAHNPFVAVTATEPAQTTATAASVTPFSHHHHHHQPLQQQQQQHIPPTWTLHQMIQQQQQQQQHNQHRLQQQQHLNQHHRQNHQHNPVVLFSSSRPQETALQRQQQQQAGRMVTTPSPPPPTMILMHHLQQQHQHHHQHLNPNLFRPPSRPPSRASMSSLSSVSSLSALAAATLQTPVPLAAAHANFKSTKDEEDHAPVSLNSKKKKKMTKTKTKKPRRRTGKKQQTQARCPGSTEEEGKLHDLTWKAARNEVMAMIKNHYKNNNNQRQAKNHDNDKKEKEKKTPTDEHDSSSIVAEAAPEATKNGNTNNTIPPAGSTTATSSSSSSAAAAAANANANTTTTTTTSMMLLSEMNIDMNDAEILRGITMRPSGRWQAQTYYKGKSRYIGVFDTREEAAIAYELVRRKVKPSEIAVAASGIGPLTGSAACNSGVPVVTDANSLTNSDGNATSSSQTVATSTAASGHTVQRYPIIRTMHAVDVRWESVKSQAHAKVKQLTGKRLLSAFEQSAANSESPCGQELKTSLPKKHKSGIRKNKNINRFLYISKLPSDKWKAEIPYGDKVRCIGSFETQDDAVVAYEHVRTSLKLESAPSAVRRKTAATTGKRTTARAPKTKIGTKKYPSAQTTDESIGDDTHRSSRAPIGVDALLMVAKNNDVLKQRSDHGFRLLEMAMKNDLGQTPSPHAATVSTSVLSRNQTGSEESMSSSSGILGKKRKHEATTSKSTSQSDIELWDSAKEAALKHVKKDGSKVLSNSNPDQSSSSGRGNECFNTTTVNGQQPEPRQEQARGISQRDSGMWQAQLYFAGRMRYIGVFRTKELASMAHEFVRNRLQQHRSSSTASAIASATRQKTTTD